MITRGVHQSVHQPGADALVPQRVRDHNREFAAAVVRIDHVTRDTVLFLTSVTLNNGDQRHFATVVDLGEANQHLLR